VRAAALLGGDEALAAYLDVAPVMVRVWMAGSALPPDRVFLQAVDLLIEREIEDIQARRIQPSGVGSEGTAS
jgi:hypothetical protein